LNNNKKSEEQQRHVLFSNNISQLRLEENSPLKNWRERVNKILTKRVCRKFSFILNLTFYI
jgi:hypothetical protein